VRGQRDHGGWFSGLRCRVAVIALAPHPALQATFSRRGEGSIGAARTALDSIPARTSRCHAPDRAGRNPSLRTKRGQTLLPSGEKVAWKAG